MSILQNNKNPWKIALIGSIVAFIAVIVAFVIFLLAGQPKRVEGTSAKKEFAQYSEELVLKAEKGNAEAQYSLGNCYFYGFGIEKDQREAVKWLRKAAEQGYKPAQNDLGHCYYSGAGVERDPEEADKWWRKAAENNK